MSESSSGGTNPTFRDSRPAPAVAHASTSGVRTPPGTTLGNARAFPFTARGASGVTGTTDETGRSGEGVREMDEGGVVRAERVVVPVAVDADALEAEADAPKCVDDMVCDVNRDAADEGDGSPLESVGGLRDAWRRAGFAVPFPVIRDELDTVLVRGAWVGATAAALMRMADASFPVGESTEGITDVLGLTLFFPGAAR